MTKVRKAAARDVVPRRVSRRSHSAATVDPSRPQIPSRAAQNADSRRTDVRRPLIATVRVICTMPHPTINPRQLPRRRHHHRANPAPKVASPLRYSHIVSMAAGSKGYPPHHRSVVDPARDGQPLACDFPDCDRPAGHRTPRSRIELRNFYWFCLEHVREYNSAWDYYAGMNAAQIETEVRRDIDWRRPTWPLGQRNGTADGTGAYRTHGLFDDIDEGPAERVRRSAAPHPHAAALAVMDLSPPITVEALKRRYKELAKRHHPDTNGGDRKAEEKLKAINIAYRTLLEFASGEASTANRDRRAENNR